MLIFCFKGQGFEACGQAVSDYNLEDNFPAKYLHDLITL